MNFLKKYWVLFFIVILGLVFRLINLDKAGGLWYDEMTIYSIASNFKTDLHRFFLFPLYYIFYHCWLVLFGNADLTIRLMSVFCDILGILMSYFVGRQIGNNLNINEEKIGIVYMLLYALNSSFIYYAQEAKFYSLTFLLVNVIVFAWLKFIQKSDVKNFILYYLASLFLILSYVSQSLLVVILYIITFIIKPKEYKKLALYSTVFLPVLIFALFIPKYFSGNFDAVVFDNSFILLMLQNWFSPILNGLQNNILNYHMYFIAHILNIKFILFVLLPGLYLIFALFYSIKKYVITRYLALVVLVYVVFHIVATYFTSYNVLVRYTLPILPIGLLICSVGISQFKRRVGLILFVIINILGIISLSGAPRIPRPDGYRMLAGVLEQNEISSKYDFILPIRTELLDKYFFISGKRKSLYLLNSLEAQKTYLSDEEIKNLSANANKNQYYKRFLEDDSITPEFEKYVLDNFLGDNTVVVLKDKSICLFTNEQLKMITSSENYEKYPIQFLRLSKLTNDMISVLEKHAILAKNFSSGNWEIFVFKL